MQLMPEISQKVLTKQLRKLEADGLIERQAYSESPPRVEYSLTAYGETLRPITELMCAWGKAHAPEFQFGLMNLKGLRILAISEGILHQRLEAELGELRGADITATSLAIALRDLREINPDIVLIDFNTDGDFRSFARHLEMLAAELQKSIPAISLTASDTDRDRAFAQGFQIHLMEPIEVAELVAAISILTGRLEESQ